MIIPIRHPTNNSTQTDSNENILEWVMIELNGELLKPLDDETVDDENNNGEEASKHVELGSVKFDSDGTPTLIIGHHQLKGTSTTLKEPFAVLRKRKFVPNTEDERETKLLKFHERPKVQYEVAGIVKKKLMFDRYPKSIMR